MSRRKLVVEGVTYEWVYSRGTITILAPKGVRIPGVPVSAYMPWWDRDHPVTPRDAAAVVYRKVLNRDLPPRKAVTLPEPRTKAVDGWATSHRLPQVHLVQASVRFLDGDLHEALLEAHESFGTAKAYADRMTAAVARWEASGRSSALRRHVTEEDVLAGVQGEHVDRIEACLLDGEVRNLTLTVVPLPVRAPVRILAAA